MNRMPQVFTSRGTSSHTSGRRVDSANQLAISGASEYRTSPSCQFQQRKALAIVLKEPGGLFGLTKLANFEAKFRFRSGIGSKKTRRECEVVVDVRENLF